MAKPPMKKHHSMASTIAVRGRTRTDPRDSSRKAATSAPAACAAISML